MSEYRWFNSHQPQTLQIAQILLYLNAVFSLIRGGLSLLIIVGAVGAFGIANEKKWGWWLALVVSVYTVAIYVVAIVEGAFKVVAISMIFAVALLIALVHEQSRSYKRIWFK